MHQIAQRSRRGFRLAQGTNWSKMSHMLYCVVWVIGLASSPTFLMLDAPISSATVPAPSWVNNCHDVQWISGHIEVDASCQAAFSVNYAENFSNWALGSYNFSFDISAVTEVNAAGHIVRLGDAGNPVSATPSSVQSQGGVNVSVNEIMNVTSATGNWTPSDAWSLWNGTNWSIGDTPIGTASLNVTFHLTSESLQANNSPNDSYTVKFDVVVSNWPWASSTDALGFELNSLGAGGSHFSYNQTNSTLIESWNETNRTFVSLEFGGVAGVSYPDRTTATSGTNISTQLFYAASPNREAVALVTFRGATGNYTTVDYDPLLAFVATPPGAPQSSGILTTWVPLPYLVGSIAIVGLFTSIGATCVHRRRLRREGTELVAKIERITAEDGELTKRDR